MHYGAAYYPEHWSEERWPTDARLMREAGFTIARLSEFAWCRMEPQPDQFDFAWLDRAIAMLNDAGIAVLLGTPTAGPPTWLVNARNGPDCRMLYEDGTRWEVGGRSLLCVNHPHFVERSRRIAAALGERYARHPSVFGFQIDNELGMYGTRCYCDHCLAGFRAWLQAKYGTVNALNQRLGMVFGSNEFGDWDDVPIPRRRQDLHNPGLLLDSQRFFSDSNVRYLRAQVDALRAAGVRQPITTNVCHMFANGEAIDGHALFEPLDVVGFDSYPMQFGVDPAPATVGLLHTIARGYKGTRHWMLEQQSGSPMGMVADDPRRIRLWAWQSIAHGAEMILYFRWRTARFGGEQYWRGILDHDGAVNERCQVVAATGHEIARVAAVLNTMQPVSDVAILLDFDASQSLVFNSPGSGISYRDHAETFFAAVQKLGVGVDVVYNADDLARYKVVIAPLLRLMDETLADGLRAYVEQGGTLVATILTATLDRDSVAPAERPPYLLQDLFGVERVEWGSLSAIKTPPKELLHTDTSLMDAPNATRDSVAVASLDGYGLSGGYTARIWYDQLALAGAAAIARFGADAPAAGAPAVTLNTVGQGRAVYIASMLEQRFYDDLLRGLVDAAPCPVRPSDAAARVEVLLWRSGDEQLYVVLNHDATRCTIELDNQFHDLLHERSVARSFALEAYDVALLRRG